MAAAAIRACATLTRVDGMLDEVLDELMVGSSFALPVIGYVT